MEKRSQAVLVGLCGRSGAGKGYVSKLFAEEGIPSIDTDGVYRELTGPCDSEAFSPCMRELAEFFGDGIRNEDNSLNRAVLRGLVFGEENKGNLQKLNEITHHHILSKTMEKAAELYEAGYPVVLIDAPVLFESGFDRFCAAVVCVTAPEEISIERIMKRDGLDRNSAVLRLRSQISAEELEKKAQFVIVNGDGEKSELVRSVRACALRLKELYGE